MQLLTEDPSAATRKRPFDRIAIASFVLSVLWIYGLGSLVGAILAVVALRRLPADPALATKRGRGLAAAALVLGTVGFIVTAIAFIVLVQAMNDLEYPM